MATSDKRHSDPERAATRRRQVLEAAETCFARSGFHGASMAEISKAAGMSAGHIYNYFDSKDAIIMAFVDRRMEEVSALLRDLGSREDPLQSMLDDASERVAEHLQPAFWTLPMEIHAEAARNPRIAEALIAADEDSRGQFRAVLKAAREKRGLAVDDATMDGRVDALISLFMGLSVRALHRPQLELGVLVEGVRVAMKALLMT